MRIENVIAEANRLIELHGEVTVRQIYYQIYPKFSKDYKNANSFYTSFDKMLVKARESGAVNPTSIIDTVRGTMGGDYGYTEPDEFLEDSIADFLNAPEKYTRERWNNQKVKPIIWVEKDALSRIINDVAGEYRVKVCPSRGYSSLPYLRSVVQEDGVKLIHFSDHDPSGLDMELDLRKRAERYAGREIPVERKALTHEQVKQFDLVPNPTKRADTRRREYVKQYGDKCWELDALPPDVLKKLVRDSIENEIDTSKWEENKKREEAEKRELEKKFEKFKKAIERGV